MIRSAAVLLVALALTLAQASPGQAQIVYGYTVPNAGGIVQSGTYYYPGGYRNFTYYYSPFTGAISSQVYGQNFLGQAYARSFGYNPWTGTSFSSGYLVPNYWVNPWGGYAYSYVRRWPIWGWRW
ncbi:MAG: hypothetical protein NZU63_06470 [Gemmataceae bacterium]|nr:hypothetical protein [Gemmataceae bacterium]MDW8242618.1 hypothetical protein [Thermogemmata sp.]